MIFAKEHLRPSPEELNLLSKFERQAFNVIDYFNAIPWIKDSSSAVLRTIGGTIIREVTKNLTHLVGLERIIDFVPQKGILIIANHRTYFDHYVIASYLDSCTSLIQNMYYPVRSNFFYDKRSGLMINLMGAAMSMYPPVFRASEKREFNHYGLRRMVELLQNPRTILGVHPEGRRNQNDDPYTLLPAQPGVGKLIMTANPHVLPVFINGLVNDPQQQVVSNFNRLGSPIIVVYGGVMDLSDFVAKKSSLRTQKEVTDHVMNRVRELGTIERELRTQLRNEPATGLRQYTLDEFHSSRIAN